MARFIKYYLFLISCIFSTYTEAQPLSNADTNQFKKYQYGNNFWANSKEIGLNFTPLISKFIPFNIGDKSSGFVGIKAKYYMKDFAFRTSFGADLGNRTLGFLHFGVGYERRRFVSKKITYTSGWQTILETQNEIVNSQTNAILGVLKFYGLEYNITENFFLGAESQFVIGLNLGGNNAGAEFSFRPPVALFANVRINNVHK
jgi:hypothetical protein